MGTTHGDLVRLRHRRSRMHRASRPLALAGMAAIVALVASGCAAERPTPKPTTSPGYTSTYTPPPATALAPLRGTSVEVGSLGNASIAAKIDNHPDARPQVGLRTHRPRVRRARRGWPDPLRRGLAVGHPRAARPGQVDPPDGPEHHLALRRHRLLFGRPAALRESHAQHPRVQRDPRAGRHGIHLLPHQRPRRRRTTCS